MVGSIVVWRPDLLVLSERIAAGDSMTSNSRRALSAFGHGRRLRHEAPLARSMRWIRTRCEHRGAARTNSICGMVPRYNCRSPCMAEMARLQRKRKASKRNRCSMIDRQDSDFFAGTTASPSHATPDCPRIRPIMFENHADRGRVSKTASWSYRNPRTGRGGSQSIRAATSQPCLR